MLKKKQLTLKKLFTIIFVVLFITSINGCKRDEAHTENQYFGQTVLIGMDIASEAPVDPENQIGKVRAVVFSEKGNLVCNEVSIAKYDGGEYTFVAKLAAGKNTIHIFCNETTEMTPLLEKIISQSEISTLKLPIVAAASAFQIPMYKKVTEAFVKIDSDNNASVSVAGGAASSTISIAMDRLMTKISFTAIKKQLTNTLKFTVESMNISVHQMPSKVSIAENVVSGNDWLLANLAADGTGKLENEGEYTITPNSEGKKIYTIPDGVDRITFPDLYIPENILKDRENIDYSTYLRVIAKCNVDGSSTPVNIAYRVNLGLNPPTNLNIYRNNHYQIYATITSINITGLHAEIVPVKFVNVDINWNAYPKLFIASELASNLLGTDTNFDEHTGLLMYNDGKGAIKQALFKQGGVVAIDIVNYAFAATDLIWKPSTITTTPTSWETIPYMTTEVGSNTVDGVAAGLGDPCRLAGLSGDQINLGIVNNGIWRMATVSDYQININVADTKINASGYGSFNSYYLLPYISQERNIDGIRIFQSPEKELKHFWANTPNEAMQINTITGKATIATNIGGARQVRCVRIDPVQEPSLKAYNPAASYLGGEIKIGVEAFSIPYHKIELISGVSSDITLTKSTGRFTDELIANIKPLSLSDIYSSRNFKLKVTGYGTNGQNKTQDITISQLGMTHSITLVPSQTLDFKNEYYRIPQTGITLNIKLNFDPNPPTFTSHDTMAWHILMTSEDSEGNHTAVGTAAIGSTGESVIIIPANTSNDIRAVTLTLAKDDSTIIYSNAQHLLLIQEK